MAEAFIISMVRHDTLKFLCDDALPYASVCRPARVAVFADSSWRVQSKKYPKSRAQAINLPVVSYFSSFHLIISSLYISLSIVIFAVRPELSAESRDGTKKGLKE